MAAATVGGFTVVASSGLLQKKSPGVVAGLGRDLEQLVDRSATPPDGQAVLGNGYRSVMAGHSDERAARKQLDKLVQTSSKVWCRESLPPVVSAIWML